jgi:predicted SAM-dependent methyltransferase
MLINHGCGSVRPSGWVNTDSSLNALFQKTPILGKFLIKLFRSVRYENNDVVYMNLNKRWKYDSMSADVVYASHLFEHLHSRSASLFLKESFRVLKSRGVLRIVIPDLYKISKKYINEYEGGNVSNPSTDFLWALNMHVDGQYKEAGVIKKLIAGFQKFPHQHKYMYDAKSMELLFKEYGFVDIIFCSYGKSDYIDRIHDVEGGKESYLSVYIEAKKP